MKPHRTGVCQRLTTLATATLLSLACTFATAAGDDDRDGWRGAWLSYWQLAPGLQALEETPQAYDDIYLFIAHLSPAGDPILAPTKQNYKDVVSQLRRKGKRVWLTIVNDVVTPGKTPLLKDPYLVSQLLSNSERRQRHIAALLNLAQRLGVDGIDIDYENLRYRDRHNFSRFARELATGLHASGMRLALTVQPKEREKRSHGAGANDWRQLCAVADRLQIMLYNEHSGKTGPGPIASTAWMGRVLDFAERQCAIERLVPAIKVIGARWGQGGVKGITYQQVMERGAVITRTPVDKVPHFSRRTEVGTESVYYEDEISIGHKLEWLSARGYRQVIVWRLGGHDAGIDRQMERFLLPRTGGYLQ